MTQPERPEVPGLAVEILAMKEAACGEDGWDKLNRDAPGVCERHRRTARVRLQACLPAIQAALLGKCGECGGSGKVALKARLIDEDGTEDYLHATCPTCKGKGYILPEAAPAFSDEDREQLREIADEIDPKVPPAEPMHAGLERHRDVEAEHNEAVFLRDLANRTAADQATAAVVEERVRAVGNRRLGELQEVERAAGRPGGFMDKSDWDPARRGEANGIGLVLAALSSDTDGEEAAVDCDDPCTCGHVAHEHHLGPDPECGPEIGRCAHCHCPCEKFAAAHPTDKRGGVRVRERDD